MDGSRIRWFLSVAILAGLIGPLRSEVEPTETLREPREPIAARVVATDPATGDRRTPSSAEARELARELRTFLSVWPSQAVVRHPDGHLSRVVVDQLKWDVVVSVDDSGRWVQRGVPLERLLFRLDEPAEFLVEGTKAER